MHSSYLYSLSEGLARKGLKTVTRSRPFGAIIHNLEEKYDGVTVADIRKFETVVVKARKIELALNFLRNCKTFNVFPKFLCF